MSVEMDDNSMELEVAAAMDMMDTEQPDLDLNYSTAVRAAIQEIVPSDDPFDAAEFSAVDYINGRFPAEQSLQLLDDALEEMRTKLLQVDKETQQLVRHLAANTQTGQESVVCAEEAIRQLSARFQDIKVASGESEQRVRAITRDIRQLDTGKRNLTASITALNHLQMLAEGVHKLQRLKDAREYGELAALLQGVLQVLQHLTRYTHIPQVKHLADQVQHSRVQLEQQILSEFSAASGGLVTASHQLAEACLVANVLDSRVRCSIMKQVLDQQLTEYRAVFAGSERDGWLSCVDLRRKWFLRAAVEFDKTIAQMFPPAWKVSARLAYAFCQLTDEQLTQAMTLRTGDIDSAAILYAHRLLSELEGLIIQKYGSVFTKADLLDTAADPSAGLSTTSTTTATTPTPASPTAADALNPFHCEQPDEVSPFEGAITGCFLPYLHIYLDTVDKRIGEHLERFCVAIKSYKFERLEEEESNVMPCCGELFTLYKTLLVEYLRISGGGRGLASLTLIFQRRLREFATRVLRQALPSATQQHNITAMPKDMKDITAIITQVQSLLLVREGVRLSCEEEVVRVCSVLVSAEYCSQMTAKLQAKLMQKMQQLPTHHKDFVSGKPTTLSTATIVQSTIAAAATPNNISLSSEEDLFHAVLSQCILLLVGHTESLCEGSLSSMSKQSWLLEQTGDQSLYVTQLTSHLHTTVPLVRYNLHTARKYFTRYCDKLAASICTKFTQQVYRCRPINSVGCEQLLLDCHALKAALLQMPVAAAKIMREPPVSYTRMVTKYLTRAELLLQVVMGEYSSSGHLLDKTIRLMPDLSIADFQKLLELRGVKEKAALLELYRQQTASTVTGEATTTTTTTATTTPEHELSKIAKLEKMLKARRLI